MKQAQIVKIYEQYVSLQISLNISKQILRVCNFLEYVVNEKKKENDFDLSLKLNIMNTCLSLIYSLSQATQCDKTLSNSKTCCFLNYNKFGIVCENNYNMNANNNNINIFSSNCNIYSNCEVSENQCQHFEQNVKIWLIGLKIKAIEVIEKYDYEISNIKCIIMHVYNPDNSLTPIDVIIKNYCSTSIVYQFAIMLQKIFTYYDFFNSTNNNFECEQFLIDEKNMFLLYTYNKTNNIKAVKHFMILHADLFKIICHALSNTNIDYLKIATLLSYKVAVKLSNPLKKNIHH